MESHHFNLNNEALQIEVKRLHEEVLELRKIKDELERINDQLGFPVGHYYSPIPDLGEIKKR